MLLYITPLSITITSNRDSKLVGIARFPNKRDAEMAATFWTGEELRGGTYTLSARRVRDGEHIDEPQRGEPTAEEKGGEEVLVDLSLINLGGE